MSDPNPHFDRAPDEAWTIIQARALATCVVAGRHARLGPAQSISKARDALPAYRQGPTEDQP